MVVSEIMLYFKLENIKSDQDLMGIINKIKHSLIKIPDPSNKIMVVTIQEVTTETNSLIPKINDKTIQQQQPDHQTQD